MNPGGFRPGGNGPVISFSLFLGFFLGGGQLFLLKNEALGRRNLAPPKLHHHTNAKSLSPSKQSDQLTSKTLYGLSWTLISLNFNKKLLGYLHAVFTLIYRVK